MKVKYLLILGLILVSCGLDRTGREIDLQKNEEIIPFMNGLSINRLELREGNLVVNDTLLQFNSSSVDSLPDSQWTAHKMKLQEWVENRRISSDKMTDLKNLMTTSNNLRIIREKGTFFFSESSWIGADWGKAYSINNIIPKKTDFAFDRVQEIKPVDEQPNWYEYYVD